MSFRNPVFAIAFAATLAVNAFAQESKASLDSIRVPPGFKVTLAAKPEDTPYSMFACFDDRGRLFIAESSGKNIHGKDMPTHPECKILVLEDKDGDGFFETSKVFADTIGIPMGVLWHNGSVYTASPPDLLRFDDTDGDGVADKRTVILTGWNVLGTASLHGPFLGPDGWLYLTDGRHGFDIQTKEGTNLKGLAARIWRLRPDGTQLQSFCGGGFDNPVELTWLPSGEMIGTMTYFTDPKNGQRDALMHWMEGGVYRKWFHCVDEFKLTGDLMPPMTKFARIAPAGLMRYRGDAFGADYAGNLFSAQFNPHRIQRHKIFREGATFRTEDEDFLTSSDPDFHPCDVLEDADGSLLIVDTGGWYVDQCPLSRVSKPEHRGAIYRVQKTGARTAMSMSSDPRGLKLELEKKAVPGLISYLGDTRPAVRDRATELLIQRKEAVLPALGRFIHEGAEVESCCAALWAVFRIGGPEAERTIRSALEHEFLEVRVAAASAVAKSGDILALKRLGERIAGDDPSVRREAATALGHISNSEAVAALLKAAANMNDRFEEHAVVYSLIRQKQPSIASSLTNASPKVRKAVLIALDQMDGAPLRREQLAPLLRDKDKELWQATLWVVSHHPDWADEVIEALRARVSAKEFSVDETETVRDALLSFCANANLQKLVADLLSDTTVAAERKLFLLDVMEHSSLPDLPANWIASCGELLNGPDATLQQRVVSLLRTRRSAALDTSLNEIADNQKQPASLRTSAMAALAVRQPELIEARFQFLLSQTAAGVDAVLRNAAAQVLGKAKLRDEQLKALAIETLAQADALTLPVLVESFRSSTNEAVGQALVAALLKSTVSADLLGGGKLAELLKNFPDTIKSSARPLLAKIEEHEAARMKRLSELEPLLSGGDVGRGRRIFFGQKAACFTCHAIGSEGGTVGPDLTSIGSIRSGRDILEAIVFPSASFVPGYEPMRVQTSDETYSGIIASQSPDLVMLKTANGELRIPRSSVQSIMPSTISIMPEGLDTSLGHDELIDLLAFLQAQNGNEFLQPTKR